MILLSFIIGTIIAAIYADLNNAFGGANAPFAFVNKKLSHSANKKVSQF